METIGADQRQADEAGRKPTRKGVPIVVKTLQPTTCELKILRVLWRLGPCTVRAVHDDISQTEKLSYTTVLKQLQIMTDKGLVRRDTEERAHVYQPTNSEAQTQKELLGDFVARVYDGSPSRLVMQALGMSAPASDEELEQIRALLRTLREQHGRNQY